MAQQHPTIEQEATNQPASDVRETQGTERQTQEEMLAAYIEQQQRMSCPGCGESAQIY